MPRIYQHATSHGKRDFAGVTEVKDLEMRDCLGLPGGAQLNVKAFKAEDRGRKQAEEAV